MTDDEMKRLRELAEKATPGPWREWGNEQGHFGDLRPVVAQAPGDGTIHKILSIFSFEHRQGNAAFIAAANPQTILSLLDQLSSTQHRLREREEECEGLKKERESICSLMCSSNECRIRKQCTRPTACISMYAQLDYEGWDAALFNIGSQRERAEKAESQLATITRERDKAQEKAKGLRDYIDARDCSVVDGPQYVIGSLVAERNAALKERDSARQALSFAAEKGVAAGKLLGEVERDAAIEACREVVRRANAIHDRTHEHEQRGHADPSLHVDTHAFLHYCVGADRDGETSGPRAVIGRIASLRRVGKESK